MLAGCASLPRPGDAPVLPDYRRWQQADAAGVSADPPAPAGWWRRLGDPSLDRLIEAALTGNTDLRTALSRIAEVRARRALSEAERWPDVEGAASARRQVADPGGAARRSNAYSADLAVRWETDLFGAQRRAVEAAQADLAATQADFDAARVSLVATVAGTYVDLRAADLRLRVLQATVSSREDTDRITRWRAQAGLASALDTAQSASSLEQARAALPAVARSLVEARVALARLAGTVPGAIDPLLAEGAPLPAVPEAVAVGIPAATLQQRPDVRAAGERWLAAGARVAQAEARRYPALTLSGTVGVEALASGDLFRPEAVLASLAGGLSAPVFDAGRIRQNIAIQSAQQEQALIAWQGTVLGALAEVETALAAWRTAHTRLDGLDRAAAAATEAERLATIRYTAGQIDLAALLDTQRTLLALQDQQISARSERLKALVSLYTALGGGWTAAIPVAGAPAHD